MLKQNSYDPPREKLARDARELPIIGESLDAIVGICFTAMAILGEYLGSTSLLIFILVVALVMGGVLITVGLELTLRGFRSRVRDALAEFDRLPNRRPIVFLRPFSRERWESFFESIMRTGDPLEKTVAHEMQGLGPVVAVGRPGESYLPLEPGDSILRVSTGNRLFSNSLWKVNLW